MNEGGGGESRGGESRGGRWGGESRGGRWGEGRIYFCAIKKKMIKCMDYGIFSR